MADEKEVKSIRILNRGAAPHIIRMKPKRTVLAPGQAAEVSPEEAKRLLAYPGMVDMAKMIPGQEDELGKLQAENAALKAQLKDLAKGDAMSGEASEKEEAAPEAGEEADAEKVKGKKGSKK